jgi:carbamoyltransferase
MNILGVSAYYHDSAACLLRDGEIISASQEERFTRRKHDHRFPVAAVDSVLAEGGLKSINEVDYLVFYDKPLVKFERLVETYIAYAPSGLSSFLKAMPLWLKEKLYMPREIRRLTGYGGKLLFGEHHESHAASAFYPSRFEEAAIICFDGVGEWATTTYWVGQGNKLEPLAEIWFPHSLGMLYSAFTSHAGFKVNSGEYKLMGLAPYGEPKYASLIREHLIDLKDDGSFRLNMEYFNYCQGLTMTNERFAELFGGPPRQAESELTQREMDLAASIQEVTEDIVLRIGTKVHQETKMKNLCMAGGVALNCVANGRLLREGPFDDIWIQPAAGDAGGSLGAAYAVWHRYLGKERRPCTGLDRQSGSYLGPAFGQDQVETFLQKVHAPSQQFSDDLLLPTVAKLLAEGNVVGWFDGRMEFGPRALGARSILGDPRDAGMQKRLNMKIKFRESFRPFAPAVLADSVGEWFEIDRPTPYMLLVANVRRDRQIPMTREQRHLFGIEKLNVKRSTIPAVTHVDYSARIQTVHEETNPRFYRLLKEFQRLTGCPVLVNTSFNVRGEPIVCTPADAYRCFLRTDMDILVMGQYLLRKDDQLSRQTDGPVSREFEPD